MNSEVTMILDDLFIEMLRALSYHNVKHMVVGGYALILHGFVRVTQDFDIFIGISPENAEATCEALAEFGAPLKTLKIQPSDFASEGAIIQLGVQPNRIYIINKISGIDFESAYSRSKMELVDGIPVRVISLGDLLVNKKASGRLKDLGDVNTIEHMLKNISSPQTQKPRKTRKTQ